MRKCRRKPRVNKNTQMTILSSFITINVDILACESKEEFSFGIELWPLHTQKKKEKPERVWVSSCILIRIRLCTFLSVGSYIRFVYGFAYKGDTLMNISTLIHKHSTRTHTYAQHILAHIHSHLYTLY